MVNIIIGKYEYTPNSELRKEGQKGRLGYCFRKKEFSGTQREAMEVRCPICGDWVRYNENNIDKFIREGRWDAKRRRMIHCGKSTCSDLWQLYLEDKKRVKEKETEKLYFRLKKWGLVS